MRGAARRVVRPLVSLALLLGLILWLDLTEIMAEVQRLSPGWAMLGLALTLPQVAVSAWRWRMTAGWLGVPIAWRTAFSDYYLSTFLNQVLPGGMMGDATRAWRHAQSSGTRGAAWRAVIIERASGQVVVIGLTLGMLVLSPLWHASVGRAVHGLSAHLPMGGVGLMAMALGGLAIGGVVYRWLMHSPPRWSAILLEGLGRDIHRALFSARAWPRQLFSSLLVVASYGAVFVCAARAIGVELPVTTLMALLPPVLLSMLIPLTVAGWGMREGAAALAWAAVGLSGAQGVAVAVSYGLLILVASLPGALSLWYRPGRRRSPPSGASGDSKVEIGDRVVSAAEPSSHRAQGFVERDDGGHQQPRTPRPDQQRRDQQMQPMQRPGFQEARHRGTPALDQEARVAQPGQVVDDGVWRDPPVLRVNHGANDVVADRPLGHGMRPDQMKGRRIGHLKHMPFGRYAPTRIEHHTDRVVARHMPHIELGVVLTHRPGPDQHCVDQAPQSMQVRSAVDAIDVMRVPALGGNSPIQALAELGNGQGALLSGERQQAVEDIAGRIGHWHLGLPLAAALNGHDRARQVERQALRHRSGMVAHLAHRVPGRQAPRLDVATRDDVGSRGHAISRSVSSHHLAKSPRAVQPFVQR
nr:lysylphosphatidylglycerol synthase transmembrane domain-containing protein [Halomonas xinjiangensis]